MSGINANVSLSLKELDDLRDQISKGDKRIHELALEIAKLESEKLQVKVTLRKDYDYMTTEKQTIRDPSVFIRDSFDIYRQPYDYAFTTVYKDVVKTGTAEKVEYVNFNDVLEDLKRNAEEAVADKITSLKNALSDARMEKSEIENKYFEHARNADLEYNKKVKEISDKFKETTNSLEADAKALQEEIKELKGQEFEKAKDRLISELREELIDLKTKLAKKSKWSLF